MKPLTYFRCALFAPVVLPLISYFSGSASGVAFLLVASLAFGGVPYLLLAALLWVRLGWLRSATEYFHLALLAPIVFVPLLWAAWLTLSLVDTTVPRGPENLLMSLLPLGGYALLFGYLYVLFISLLFVVLRRIGAIAAVPVEGRGAQGAA